MQILKHIFILTFSVGIFNLYAQESQEVVIYPESAKHMIKSAAAYSPDGKNIASAAPDNTIKIWDALTGQLSHSLDGYKNSEAITWIEYSPNGEYLLATSYDQSAKLWNMKELVEIYGFSKVNFAAQGTGTATFSPDSKFIAVSIEKNIVVYEIERKQEVLRFSADGVWSLAYSPDGEQIAAGFMAGLKIYNTNTGSELKNFYGGATTSLIYSPDGKRIIASSGLDIKIVDAQNLREIKTIQGPGYMVTAVSYSNHSNSFIASSYSKTIKIWNSSGNEILSFIVPAIAHSISFSSDDKYILTALVDGTIRIYDSANAQEILDFISFDDDEWICITPDGYYNASPHGDIHLNIRFGDDAYSIEQFSRAFYHPDVVLARLQGQPNPDVVKQFGDIRLTNAPPAVSVAVTKKDDVTGIANLKISAFDEFNYHPIENIEIIINGRLVGGEELKTAKGANVIAETTKISTRTGKENKIEFELSVKLESGTNYIEVVAVNEVNYGVKTLDVKSAVNAIQEKPDLWLLSIGINDYANFPANGWADLDSAVGDATKMFSLFDGQNNKRFKNIHKVIVADGTVNKPTKQNILKNMEMLKQAKSNDVIFLFIAAHGITEEEVYYFLPSDVKFNSSKDIDLKYAVNIDEIIKSTDMPGKKIIFIDTCQSGGVDNNKLIRTLRNRSTVIFTAAKQNEFSNETPDYGGVFTYSVVEGINNNPLNKRSITLQDLEHYVANRINDLLPRLKKNKQHPVMIIPDGYKNFVMAEYE